MDYDPDALRRFGLSRQAIQELHHSLAIEPRRAPAAFSVGIEEEYFLSDTRTKRAAFKTPESLFAHASAATEGRVGREFLQNQVEAATPPFSTLEQARTELQYIRRVLSTIASEHGLSVLACGTHPTARWQDSAQSETDRYDRLMDDLQMIGRRNMLCGMHVHVELPDPDRRVEVMYRLIPYLPLFLALSTSSPFWQSRETGLKGYRLAAYDELPRTGIPELFRTQEDFDAYVAALVSAGIMKDASYIWWMIRPSSKYPTLELRAPDCCTRLDDAVAIAALYRVLVRHLTLNPSRNRDITLVTRAIATENKWRAQRYGVGESFVTDEGAVSMAEVLDEVIAMTAEDAEALSCIEEVARCRAIIVEGTSADIQLEVFRARSGEGPEAALSAVVDWIAETTVKS